ncbi:MAG: hypothetical protein ABFD89_00950 [Bryobacteraceae bacterium]
MIRTAPQTRTERELLDAAETLIENHKRINTYEQRVRDLEAMNREWLKENGRGGWIDELRQRVKELEAAKEKAEGR